MFSQAVKRARIRRVYRVIVRSMATRPSNTADVRAEGRARSRYPLHPNEDGFFVRGRLGKFSDLVGDGWSWLDLVGDGLCRGVGAG